MMSRRYQSCGLMTLCGLAVLLAALPTIDASRRWNIPFISKRNQQYTPLIFFTVPPGLLPEVDAMEKAVRRLERDLNVRVERLDLLREPASEACLSLLTRTKSPPFLYNRLTLQTISIPSPVKPVAKSSSSDEEDEDGSSKSTAAPVSIDMTRLRAWAKNRLLPAASASTASAAARARQTSLMNGSESDAIDQAELLEDIALTPRQREGKEKIQKRTKSKGGDK